MWSFHPRDILPKMKITFGYQTLYAYLETHVLEYVLYILNSSFWNECNIKNVDNCSGMHPTFYCLPMCFNKTQTTEQLLEIYICLQNQLLKNRDMHVDTILTTHQSCITPTSNLPIDVVLHIELPVYLQNEF